MNLRPREDHGEPRRAPGANDALEPWQLPAQHLVVEEEQGRQRLVLGRGADPALRGEAGEKIADLTFSHVGGVSLAVVQDESSDPSDVRLFGPGAEVPAAELLTDSIEKPGGLAAQVGRRGFADCLFGHAPSPFGGADFRARGERVPRLYAHRREGASDCGSVFAERMKQRGAA